MQEALCEIPCFLWGYFGLCLFVWAGSALKRPVGVMRYSIKRVKIPHFRCGRCLCFGAAAFAALLCHV
jgi:hypothetical protein